MEPDVVLADTAGQALDIFLCAKEWYRKDIHSHMHSHPSMHTPLLLLGVFVVVVVVVVVF